MKHVQQQSGSQGQIVDDERQLHAEKGGNWTQKVVNMAAHHHGVWSQSHIQIQWDTPLLSESMEDHGGWTMLDHLCAAMCLNRLDRIQADGVEESEKQAQRTPRWEAFATERTASSEVRHEGENVSTDDCARAMAHRAPPILLESGTSSLESFERALSATIHSAVDNILSAAIPSGPRAEEHETRRMPPLPPCYFELVRRDDGAKAPEDARPEKVVLLHGWMQNCSMWRGTAETLRDMYGHDVALVDFYGHGRSPGVYPPHIMSVDLLVRQVREVVQRLGWDHEPLVFGGASMGGAVSARYALAYPDNVGAIVLVSSPGLSEPWWSLVWLLLPVRLVVTLLFTVIYLALLPLALAIEAGGSMEGCARAVPSPTLRRSRQGLVHNANSVLEPLASLLRWLVLLLLRLCGHVRLVWDTPKYGLPDEAPEMLRDKGVGLALVWGGMDILHTAQVDRWSAGRSNVPRLVKRFWDHTLVCTRLDSLSLAHRSSWWRLPESATARQQHRKAPKRADSADSDYGIFLNGS